MKFECQSTVVGELVIDPESFKKVESTRVHSYKYLPENKILLVRFNKGDHIYIYHGIGNKAYNKFIKAGSIGKAIQDIMTTASTTEKVQYVENVR